jgi:hypothetical protein
LQALPEPGEQEQIFWQWDFEQPLLSLQAATQAYNNLQGKQAAGTPLTMNSAGQINWSGTTTTNGLDTSGSLDGAAIPASSGLFGNLSGTPSGPAPIASAGVDQSGGSSNTAPGAAGLGR